MGALEINPKKRDATPTTFNHKLDSSLFSETHVFKRPKFAPNTPDLSQDRPVVLRSTASRVLEYPEKKTRFRRPVHAPCRARRFSFLKGVGRNYVNYMSTKKEAFSTFRFCAGKHGLKVVDTDEFKYGGLEGKEVFDVEEVEVIDTDDCKEVEVVDRGKGKLWECDEVVEMDRDVEGANCQPSCSSVISDDMIGGNLKVDGEKSLEMVERREELEKPSLEKLKKSVEKRNENLGFIGSMIDFCNKKLSMLQFLRPAKKPVKDVDRMLFVPLTQEEENEVSTALSNAKRRRLLVTHQESNIEITGELLQCLKPCAWLNDEVINLYLVLLKERELRDPQKFLKCHFFNTFFYKKLVGGRSGYDYKSVRRWTTQRKLGYCLFECDKIFIPIHKEIHWCLAVINKKDEKFQYLDSLRGRDKQVMSMLARYFVDEVKDKSGKDIDVSSWKQEFVEDLPEQQNGYDCGVFMIKYSDFYSRDVGLCFNQEHMPYFRRRTAKEILRLKAD
ncbi:hypothetical protein ACET3Z_024355 [Daucus carota]